MRKCEVRLYAHLARGARLAMAAGTKEGEEVFEINDYTFASPWEKFVGAIEEVLVKWGLHGDAQGLVRCNLELHCVADTLFSLRQ